VNEEAEPTVSTSAIVLVVILLIGVTFGWHDSTAYRDTDGRHQSGLFDIADIISSFFDRK
jgi:hypothetical protein